ncbi:MAG: Ketoisovalerate oxidoreductase subunit VorA [Candidatus Thorarchaeota archaeon]|nr:MAG: Ketoisovalerate oxidoreductase subunit VorA [Candidatus Thorarchaeota archaeon]
MKTELMSANYAAARAVVSARVEVVAAYPITPATTVPEQIALLSEKGIYKGEFIRVESEHSAMFACIGASSTGARAFTATSSNGLLLMDEALHWASAARLPIVLANINRSVSPSWNIHVSHDDSMSKRDTGWIQFYVSSVDEFYHTIIQAFKLAEDERVLMPTMVNADGFVLSHTVSRYDYLEPEEVDKFLQPYSPPHWVMDPENPVAHGNIVFPEHYQEFRYSMHEGTKNALDVYLEIEAEYKKLFGKYFGGPIECYKCDDADYIMTSQGTIGAEARDAIDQLRKDGYKVGSARIRMYRPFPIDHIRDLAKGKKAIASFDRSVSYGFGGPVANDIRASLYATDIRPLIKSYIGGLGGRDITVPDIKEILLDLIKHEESGEAGPEETWHDLR